MYRSLGVLVFMAAVLFVSGCGGGNTEQACREAIETRLQAPATAEYVSTQEIEGGYKIEVDAENSLGVPLRTAFFCYTEDGQVSELLTEDEQAERVFEDIERGLE